MKFLQGFSKRLLSLVLASLMLFMLSIPSFADLWVAPTDAYYKKDVYYLLDDASGRRKMNLFLSNFSEASLKTFDSKKTSDKDILNFLFKHFELNASLYSGVIINDDGVSGKVMTVTQDTIEKAAKNMFNRTFTSHPVSGFSGYKDGNYIVTADEAGSPLKVLSIASYIEYYGKNDYKVQFEIYKTESNIDDYYSCSSNEAQTAALQKIGEGSANFNYVGGTGSSAFRLTSYFIDPLNTTEFIYTKPNKPISTGVTTTAPKTTITQQTTTFTETTTLQKTTATQTSEISSSQTETLPVSETSAVSKESTTISDKAVINDAENKKNSEDKSESNKLILITVFVVLAAITATVIIVLLFKKKK